MPKLKVALLAAEFLPNWGGAGTYNVRLVRHLMDRMDFHVITPRRTIPGSSIAYSVEEIESFFDRKIKVHYVSEAGNTFVYNSLFQWAVRQSLPALHRQYKFDLVHTDHPHMSDLLLRLRPSVPHVRTVHTTFSQHLKGIRTSHLGFFRMEPSERYQVMLSLPLRSIERIYLGRSRHMITVSQWMQRELAKRTHRPVEVIYSGVEPEQFLPGQTCEALRGIDVPIVLFTSRMTAAKGAQFLIKAIPQVLKHTDRVHFVFAGSDLEEPWASMLAASKVDPKHYTFLGYLPYEQLPSLYSRASVYVCPSLCENLPARILEAMSCEVPVVATGIYGIPEAVEDNVNGLLVPPGDGDAVAAAILRLLEDDGLRLRLGKQARRTVLDKFDWSKLAAQTGQLYERVVNER